MAESKDSNEVRLLFKFSLFSLFVLFNFCEGYCRVSQVFLNKSLWGENVFVVLCKEFMSFKFYVFKAWIKK